MTTEPKTVPLDDLAAWIHAYDRAQAEIKKYEQIAQNCRAQIERRLGDAEVGTVDGRPAVRWTTVQSSRVDVTKLKAEYPDLAEAVTVPVVSRRFTLVKADGE